MMLGSGVAQAEGSETVASSEVGAKQLAMYADNPVRYCSLRGQLEGAAGTGANRRDDDVQVRQDPLGLLWRLGISLGFVLLLLGGNDLFRWTTFRLAPGQEIIAVSLMLVGLACLMGGCWGIFNHFRLTRKEEICERFDLDPLEFRIHSAAIMGNPGRRFESDGLMAVPHALFQRRGKRQSYHVGLLLNRPYAGKVHDADLFRLTLQMGIVRRAMGVRTVTGSIRYAGKLVKIAYSESLYNSLKNMKGEFSESVKQWWPKNRQSLRLRQRVAAGAMVESKEIEWPDEYLL